MFVLLALSCSPRSADALQRPGDDSGGALALPRMRGPVAPVAPSVITRDGDGGATVRAIKLGEPLRIDGKLDEPVYSSAPPIDGFLQMLPREGEAATERTEAWILFDTQFIYVSARCWDSASEDQWIANELRRDNAQLRQNDSFGVAFDTFYDGRNAFGFYTNPLGALADLAIADESSILNDWNQIWTVRTGRFEGGWSVEIAIPFRSVRYRPNESPVWGVQMRRGIRRKNEWTYLTRVPASAASQGGTSGGAGISRVSAYATLVGLEVPSAGKNLELKPFGISRSTVDLVRDPTSKQRIDGDFGVDAKYGLTSNLTADLTYNTDFAQVEIDEQQVNLTRFNLMFPEKRDFFLEGRGLFAFGQGSTPARNASDDNTPTLFFSRRIGLQSGRSIPIRGGARLTGKVGEYGIGALNIQTAEDSVAGAQPTNFTVLRVKRDILRRSSVGALFTNRSRLTSGPGTNQVYGVDAGFAFYENVTFAGYLARTTTPRLDGDDKSYQAKFDYTGDRYGAHLNYLTVGEHFNPEVGFLRRTDFKRSFALLRFSPRPRSVQGVRLFSWEANLEYIVDGLGYLESRQQQARFNTEFETSDQLAVEATASHERLLEPFVVSRGAVVLPGAYSFNDVAASYTFGAQRRSSGTFSLRRGGFYNGTITSLGYTAARIELTRQLSVEPNLTMNRVTLPDGTFTTQLLRTRLDYAFTPRMFASALVQYNSGDRTSSSNLRLRWEYQPGSEVFLVYSDERDTTGRGFPSLQNRAIVVKLTRLFRF
jgi:hypothetical protein